MTATDKATGLDTGSGAGPDADLAELPDGGRGADPETRLAVHRAAGRLGASHPRQEGPADLRLVPPALAAWATAAVTLDTSLPCALTVAAVCVVLALALLAPEPLRVLVPIATSARRDGAAELRAPGGGRGWRRISAAAVLLCVAASAASAALHGADRHRGPVPALARQYAMVTMELEITSDPRPVRPRVTGDHMAPATMVADAEAVQVTTADGATSRIRTPVLVIVRTAGPGDRAAVAEPASPWQKLLPGTHVRARARLAPPQSESDTIAAVARVAGQQAGEAPTVVRRPSATQRFAGSLREGLRTATADLASDARALLPGLVVGDTARVSPELAEAFKATDLTHVLAVSGANFAILLAVLIGPSGIAQRAERRGLAPRLGIGLRSTALLGGVLTLGFVIVCRPEPSVLRAAACGVVALLAIATGRRRSLIPALAAVVLLLVLYDPWLSRSYGFLLSVLATGALLTIAPRWSAALRGRGLPPRVAEAVAAAAAAQAVCAPVVAVLAARVSLVAVPCNLLAESAVAPATVLGFGTLAAAPVSMPLAKTLAWCASWPARWLATIARTGADLPGSSVDWPGGWQGGLLLGLATALGLWAVRRPLRHPWICVAGACALLLFVVQPPPLARVLTGWPPSGWRFVVCDVGQGDATVLAAGDGTGVVVDAGPDAALVDHCLRSLGVTRVPLVLLTHFHADHVAGLPGVLRGRRVGAIETTGLREPSDQAAFVARTAAARHIPVTSAKAGERRRAGGLSWQVLWPPSGPSPPKPWPSASVSSAEAPSSRVPSSSAWTGGPNDASVTLLVRTGGLTLLLPGDLEPPAQRELLRSPAGAALRAVDVLKVAHHGSAYQDQELLRRLAPRFALVSCGENNPYGHPSARTVQALRAQGAVVLRTDRDGALAVTGSADNGPMVAASSARRR